VTEGLLGLHRRIHYRAQRPTTDSTDFHPREPSLPGSKHDAMQFIQLAANQPR